MASVWIVMACSLGVLACHRAPPPVAPPPAEAPEVAPPVARCESCPVDPSVAMMVVQAHDPIAYRSIQQIDIDVFEGGKSILSTLTFDRRAALTVYGLRAGTPLELVVAARGYTSQRRSITLQGGQNLVYFSLGRPGMAYYRVQDTQIPFDRAKTRYIVLRSRLPRATLAQDGPRLRAYAARSPQVILKRLAPDPARPRWYRDFVMADVSFGGPDPGRARSDFAHHLRAHPEDGTLAILIHERPNSGQWFAGEIVIGFKKLLDPAELLRFADRYDLVFTSNDGARLTFTMRTPTTAFQDVLDRIEAENPVVVAYTWSTVDAVDEPDRGL